MCLGVLASASLLLMLARSHNALYAAASLIILSMYLVVLVVDVMRAEDTNTGAGTPSVSTAGVSE